MVKVFIQMDDEKLTWQEIDQINTFLDNQFARVGGYKDAYGCYTNGRFETFGAMYANLSHIAGFLEHTKLFLWFDDDGRDDGDFYIEDWLEDKPGHSLVLMDIDFNQEKLKYAGTSAEEFLFQYTDFCDTYDISRPQAGTFAASGEHARTLISYLVDDLTNSDFFLYAVNSWYWDIDGETENLLEGALQRRKRNGTLKEWDELANRKIFTIQK